MTNPEFQCAQPAPEMTGGDLPCPRCNGAGFELQWSDNSPDAHQVEVNCDHCDGAGSLGTAYTHLSQALKRERERSKKHTDELHWLKSGPFLGLRADKSIQTVADRLDELADACGKYDQRSERASDIRAAATAWRKHLAGPAIPAPEGGPTACPNLIELAEALESHREPRAEHYINRAASALRALTAPVSQDPEWEDQQIRDMARLFGFNDYAIGGRWERSTFTPDEIVAFARALLSRPAAQAPAEGDALAIRQALEVLESAPHPVEHVLPFSNVCDCTQCGSVRAIKSAKAILRAAVAQ